MESIQVALRLRPLSNQEQLQGEESIWDVHAPHHIQLQPQLHKELVFGKRLVTGSRTSFTFDNCFGPIEQNQTIYSQSVRSIVLGSLKGINGSVFVYGQTGSGKTYTMLGPHDKIQQKGPDQGILLLSLRELFDNIERDQDRTYMIRCSYIEIYNEQIFDLLKPPSRLSEFLSISEDQKKEFFVKGVTEESISTVEEILDVLQRGENNRHYAQTSMNHHSSRSHAIFRLNIQTITNERNYQRRDSHFTVPDLEIFDQSNIQEDDQQEKTIKYALISESVLNFIDLAGSEKVSNHSLEEPMTLSMVDSRFEENQGGAKSKERLKEGQYINKSLFFLTQVILLRAEEKGHIPYRNSSLTKILRSSLSGNSRTLIILCVNPTYYQFEYSLSTIRFGMNAKKIENKVEPNIRNHDEATKFFILELEKRITELERIKLDDTETIDLLKNQLHSQTQLKDDIQERLILLNMNKLNQQIVVQPVKGTLATTIQFAKQKDGIHMDNVGDIFQTMKGKSNTSVKLRVRQFKHDCQGMIVQAAFKAQKQRSIMLQQQIILLLENYNQIKDEYLVLSEQQTLYKNQLETVQQENEHFVIQYEKLYNKSEEMAKLLDLTQISKFIDKELDDLKQFHVNYVKEIEEEQWRRKLLLRLGVKQSDTMYSRSMESSVISDCKDIVDHDKFYATLYEDTVGYEKYIQQIRDVGSSLINKVSHYMGYVPEERDILKAAELDSVFFYGFNDQWNQDQVISFQQLQLLMSVPIKVEKSSTSQSLLKTPSANNLFNSTISPNKSSPQSFQSKTSQNDLINSIIINSQGKIDYESEKKNNFKNNQQGSGLTGSAKQIEHEQNIKTFAITIQSFSEVIRIGEENLKLLNYDIPQIELNSDQVGRNYREPESIQYQSINSVQLLKRTYQTPENKLKTNYRTQPILPAKKSSHTPNNQMKPTQKDNQHVKLIDRQNGQNKNQALLATKIRRQAASNHSAKHSLQTINVSNNSKQNASKQSKVQNRFKHSSSLISADENMFSSQVTKMTEQDKQFVHMSDITNSNSANKSQKILAKSNNINTSENFQRIQNR